MIAFADVLGIFGVIIQLGAYAHVQWRREFAKTMAYSFCNALGTLLLVISLYYKWNLASFIGNLAWFCLSVYGMARCAKYNRRQMEPAPIARDI